jgi:ADP-ribose pyrophosphatase
MAVRCTAKAVIVHNGRVLLNRCRDRFNGEYYSLPGGGQNQYESLSDAVIRECREETGYTVMPLRFAVMCEEICDSAEFREKYPQYAHKSYHIFMCELANEERAASTETDDLQIGIEWVEIDKLDEIKLLPNAVGKNIKEIIGGTAPVFLDTEHIPYNHG